ncbi:beta-lactamase family protein [Gemmata sp. JC673]|uniref:Beta-lactamase family protein n=1 Tax=Gemmata algarum TaxID=2975278 RepID=A0ABU5F4L6_9BACT|nr:serine hydrolase domain-containing protein [Gemmata algarum]MDY3562521.1 beta-lactamase family protein [Gemmata algarum]
MPRTRRTFLTSAALGAVGLQAFAEPPPVPTTGAENANLEPFDQLFQSFLARHKLAGAAVAVARGGKLVYARGFGFADAEQKTPVAPDARFRIASVSKPITAVAVLMLAEQGKLKLDDAVLKYIKLKPAPASGVELDERWQKVTVRQCLRHTGGWDRDREGGFDPISVPGRIRRALQLDGPPTPDDIVRYMMGQPLDFDPGARFAYSNLGYLVLGRVLEAVTGQRYEPWVKKHVFGPLGATAPALARGLPENRSKAEVSYHDAKGRKAACLYPPRVGRQVPLPDGAMNVEAFEAHGGWVASAVDLVRFAAAFDGGRASPLLSDASVRDMWARPDGAAGFGSDKKPREVYYGCGWNVRPVGDGKLNAWHDGWIPGTNTLLVRRWDGLSWAVLFNTDSTPGGDAPSGLIDAPVHRAAGKVQKWPNGDLFEKFM